MAGMDGQARMYCSAMPSKHARGARGSLLVLAFASALLGAGTAIPGSIASAAPSIKLKASSHLKARTKVVSIPNARIVLKGSLASLAAGDRVLVKARTRGRRAKRKFKTVSGTAGQRAKFKLSLKLQKRGRYTITAQRVEANGKRSGPIAKLHVWVVMAHASSGYRGVNVRALQHGLKRLGYLVSVNGRYEGTTARAVLAFRKVNGLARNMVASRAVFRKLAKGTGGYKLRYPKAGKHVEFDWSRQVVVLARGAKPVMTLTTSSGAPGTPTGLGKFHFWLKQAGYNQKQMYYSVYFNGGEAIHGFASVPNFPASHGCLRIPIANAIRVYNWVDLGNTIYTYK